MPKVAVLHTSFVFVTVEPVITDLIGELIPEAEILHFVDSDVLATVVREQGISEKSEARMVHLAQAAEAVKSPDGKKIAEYMRSGKTFKTVIGDIAYDKKGDITRPDYVMYVWKKAADGKIDYTGNEVGM